MTSPTISLTSMNFGAAVTGIAECVCEALEAAERPVCTCCLGIGTPVADCACECSGGASGRVTVYPQNIAPSRSWPQSATLDAQSDHACGPPYLMLALNVEITRCVPWGGADGTPPSCDELRAAALDWYADATIIRQAVGCCLREMKATNLIARFSIGATTPVPEQGGCAGSVTQALVGLKHCICAG